MAGRRILWALLVAVAGACSSSTPCPTLPPLGTHDAEVGVPWSLPLVALSPGAGQLRWTLLEGPKDLTLDTGARSNRGPRLVWLATALDLALVPPGQPRAAGRPQPIRVEACDAAGCCAEQRGTIRAVPTL